MSKISFRKLALLLAAVTALLLATAPVASAGEEEYPAPDCSLSVSPEDPDAGDDITITGEGWPAGATVTVTVGGVELDPVTADDEGSWEVEYTIPESTPEGEVSVTADGCEGGEDEVLGTTITVGPAAVAPQPEALPATGSSSTEPLVRTAAVLIAAGAVLVYAVRRRSQAAAG
jgi:hypothetical protein